MLSLSKVLYHIASIKVPLLHSGALLSFYSVLGHFFSFSLCFHIHIYLQATALPLILLPFIGILTILPVSLVSLVHLLSLLLTDKSFRLSHSYYKTKSGMHSFIFSILKKFIFSRIWGLEVIYTYWVEKASRIRAIENMIEKYDNQEIPEEKEGEMILNFDEKFASGRRECVTQMLI